MIAGINTIDKIALFLALIVTALRVELRHLVAGDAELDDAHHIRLDHRRRYGARVCQRPADSEAINWHQGQKILITLAVSPVVGFLLVSSC
jgi:hypothetical protein